MSRRQTRAELTKRTLNAIRSPHVDVIAHPSGRKIGRRDDLDLDWDVIYNEAARTGTALEMNGSPPRLDLAVERARRAVAVGCVLAIDSDAHDLDELDFVRWGISQARRAWVTPRRRREYPVARRSAGLGRRQAGARVSASRTIAAMDDRSARRDLALVAVTVVGLSRLLEPPLVWVVAAALLGAMLFGTLQVLADEAAPGQAWFGVAIESLILPSVAAVACLGAIRLVPFGLWLAPALGLTWLVVIRTLSLEARITHGSAGLAEDDRTALLVTILLVAFLGFTGVAAMVPGGLVQTAGAIDESNLLVLAAGDALVAGLLGYRAMALRVTNVREALGPALTYAAAIAIGAAAIRAMEIPRLVGPALLTLAFYLWDAFVGSVPMRRRDRRWISQITVLAGLGIVVALWNLLLRSG